MESALPPQPDQDDSINIAAVFTLLRNGIPLTLGLALLGLVVGAAGYFASGAFQTAVTSTRVVFSFPGFERGEYPDKSKFQPDDLRSPEIISEALTRRGLEHTKEQQGTVRAALSIEGIIPDNIIKERDRLRASGQTPRLYVPDEYTVTLALPRLFPLSSQQRGALLDEIVNVYREKFTRTYISLPFRFGKAIESLKGADYFDYELVLSQENQNIEQFLTRMAETAKSFRSQRTNLSFGDLLKQNSIFTQVRLNETLGLIRQYGLSKDRKTALLKMDYYLKILSDDERKAIEEERVVQSLLKQTQERAQNYVLGVKSQATQQRNDTGVVVDQGLVDSLLANDANNFLVRQALDASLKTCRIRSDRIILQDRRDNMAAFEKTAASEKSEVLGQFSKSLDELKAVYDSEMSDLRLTYEDYQNQQFADAIRVSMQTKSDSFYRGLIMASLVGLFFGTAFGMGLALLGASARRPKRG